MSNFSQTTLVGRVHPTTGNSHENPLRPDYEEGDGWWIVSCPDPFYKHFLTFQFYDNSPDTGKYGNPIIPTAGTITIEATDNGTTYGAIHGGVIELGKPYQQPNCLGHVEGFRIKIAGFTSAKPNGKPPIVVATIHSYC